MVYPIRISILSLVIIMISVLVIGLISVIRDRREIRCELNQESNFKRWYLIIVVASGFLGMVIVAARMSWIIIDRWLHGAQLIMR